MNRQLGTAFTIVAGLAVLATGTAQSSGAKPKVSSQSARAIASARVPHGTIKSQELEREHGRLIYSFDFKVPGKSGIEEVHVDAMNGKVLSIEHEGPKAESQEK
ncbi:MAG: PepSY domain-containing protein [Candidatus Eisenbacteria bacterium]